MHLSFPASVAAHLAVLLLILLATQLPPILPPLRLANPGIEVALTTLESPMVPQPKAETLPTEPEPRLAPETEHSQLVPEPLPSRAVAVPEPVRPPPPRPPPKRVGKPRPPTSEAEPSPAARGRRQSPPYMEAPAEPAPAVIVTDNYLAGLVQRLSLESHKRYAESALKRGEEARAVVRLRVDRSGRVLNYVLVQSTGHADLDAATNEMMRGASLPPFPRRMTASDIEVTVTIRFGPENKQK